MKRLLTVIICIFLCLQCAVCAGAELFEGELYTIELPEGYSQASEDGFISDNGSVLSVGIGDNTEEKLCFADMSEKEIEEYTSNIAAASKDAFTSLGLDGEISIVSSEKIKDLNGKTALVTVVKTSVTTDGEKREKIQKMYEFTGVNNKFTFSYTPSDDETINDFDEAFGSIEIKEAEIDSLADKLTSVAIGIAVVLLIVLGIAKFFRKPKPKKKRK